MEPKPREETLFRHLRIVGSSDFSFAVDGLSNNIRTLGALGLHSLLKLYRYFIHAEYSALECIPSLLNFLIIISIKGSFRKRC
jgi:hypothetical protein